MSEQLRCLDSQPNLLIPRMYFTFEPDAQIFQYSVPTSDALASTVLKAIPRSLQSKKPKKSFSDSLQDFASKNIAGEISIKNTERFMTASLHLDPLPPYDEVASNAKSYREELEARNTSRRPYLIARQGLLRKLADLSELQYYFGVYSDMYDYSLPPSPARLSLFYDYGQFFPITVVRTEFETTLQSLTYTDIAALSRTAQMYVINHDPEMFDTSRQRSRVDDIAVGRYGIYSEGGDFAYGQRGTTMESALETDHRQFRIQSGDIYEASAHNSGIPYEDIFGMLAVGLLNRKTLQRIIPNTAY